ncbi:MAG TPA: transcription elongation factor GreB, partial [Gammaproteobacteria bacterium]|nr:transcription elongation factor GreB [Gammaproteobacteria bacterium]
MGRYRAPEPPKTAIITPRGSARLRAELSHLWKVKRPEVTARVAAA